MTWNRKEMMKAAVASVARTGELHRIDPVKFAKTYGTLPCEVEAEMLKHQTEGGDK